MADAAEGRTEPIAELYVRHIPSATRLAYLITRDEPLAEDIAQDAFLQAVGRFRHLRRADAFEAYLRRSVVNRCTSHFRRERRARAFAEREAATEPVAGGPDLGRRDELRTVLLALPVRQRAAVVLRYYADLSEEQAGEALGCSAAAVRSMVARAMETLRARIPRNEEP